MFYVVWFLAQVLPLCVGFCLAETHAWLLHSLTCKEHEMHMQQLFLQALSVVHAEHLPS